MLDLAPSLCSNLPYLHWHCTRFHWAFLPWGAFQFGHTFSILPGLQSVDWQQGWAPLLPGIWPFLTILILTVALYETGWRLGPGGRAWTQILLFGLRFVLATVSSPWCCLQFGDRNFSGALSVNLWDHYLLDFWRRLHMVVSDGYGALLFCYCYMQLPIAKRLTTVACGFGQQVLAPCFWQFKIAQRLTTVGSKCRQDGG